MGSVRSRLSNYSEGYGGMKDWARMKNVGKPVLTAVAIKGNRSKSRR